MRLALYPGATVEDFEILRRIRRYLVTVWLLRWWRGWRKSFLIQAVETFEDP